MLLKDKVAIITGAAQGIGLAIARMYSEQGAAVALLDMQQEKTQEAAAEIAAATGNRTAAYAIDITDRQAIETVVAAILQTFGTIDILVNNAGVLRHALLLEMQEWEWDLVFNVNVKGTFMMTQAVGRQMSVQRSGCIVNMSSCSGKKPTVEEGAYCASKSAIIGLTRVTALELGAYGIRCNAICPGATDTEMVRSTFLTSPDIERRWIEKTALKRLGTPRDMANVAVFLASELSGHMTGEALIVSAGEIMGQ